MDALVRETRARLLRVAARIGAPQDAEDSVQAAYHALLRSAPGRAPEDVTGWLVTTTVRIAYRRKAEVRRESVLAARLAVPRTSPSPDGDAERDARIRREVHRLPAKYRDAVVLHHLEELPVADAARLLGVPEATVRTRTRRGRALLAFRLSPLATHAAFALPWAAADAGRAVIASMTGATAQTSFHAAAKGTGAAAGVGGAAMSAKLVAVGVVCLALGAGLGAGAAAVVVASPGTPVSPNAGGAGPREVAARAPAESPAAHSDDAPPPRTPAPRAGAAPADEAAIRRIVREEMDRAFRDALVAAEGARAGNASPGEKLADAQTQALSASLASARRAIIERDVIYEFDADRFPVRPDPARLERYPDERVWPKRVLGHLETDPSRYRLGKPDGSDYPGEGAHWFAAPVTGKLYAKGYASLVLAAGVATDATVTLGSYGSIDCAGSLDGKVFLESYATVLARGPVTGTIEARSYANLVVDGPFSGTFRTTSSCNAYLLGGFTGALELGSSRSMVHIAGFTPRSALDRVGGKAGLVVLDGSDLETGTHKLGGITVRVGGPQ